MPSETATASRSRRWLRLLIVFVVAFDAAAFFQWADGAFQSEFGGHPDEGAHYVAAAQVRDAAVRSTPAFDLALGGWMLVCGASRTAALLFMAALAAATATLIFRAVHREFGTWPAAAASLLWLCAPAVRESYETILPGQFHALALTAAVLIPARLADARSRAIPASESAREDSAWCKMIGAAARIAFVGILAFVLAVAVKILPGDSRAAWDFLKECVLILGVAAAACSVTLAVLRERATARLGTTGVALIAAVACVLIFRWLKPGVGDGRVLILATPALAMLAVRGALSLAEVFGAPARFAPGQPRRRALMVLLLLLLALPPDLLSPREKDWRGFGPVARSLLEESQEPARVLVVSDSRGEGMLLAEIAMRDPARRIAVERGSATLANPTVNDPRGRPRQRFLSDEKLLAHLTSGRIRYIVLDSAVPQDVRADYHDQAQRVIEDNVRSFWPITESPIIRDGEPMGHPLRIFRVMPPEGAEPL